MKHNIVKYIFGVFVVVLIVFSIYYIRKQEDDIQQDIGQEIQTEQENLTTITTLRVGAVNLDTMNPIMSNNQDIQNISKLIYEPMLEVSENYEIRKCLAKEWMALSDTAYVVVLNEGILWHNGGEVTASDVKFTMEQIINAGTRSIYYSNLQHVTNIEILSQYTIKITIDEKIPFFEYNLTFPIMSSQYYGEEQILDNPRNNNAPGTGKYIISNITGTEVELKRNGNWWGLDEDKNLKLETILVKLYTSMGEAYNAFKLGNLDLITTQSINYSEYIGTIGYNTAEYVGRQHDYIAYNCSDDSIFKYSELRKAVNYAIDKSGIIASVYENKYYVTDFPISTENYLYNIEKVSSSYNTNKSREVLEEAGWTLKNGVWQKNNNGTIRARVDLVVNESNVKRVEVAEKVKEQLDEFGIEVNIIRASDAQYARYLENKNYDMILTGKITGISPDLTSYIGKGNLSNYEDSETKRILSEIADLTDDSEELELKYKRLIKIIEDDRPFTSLYFNKSTVICVQDLTGNIKPNNYNIFYNIEDWVRQY